MPELNDLITQFNDDAAFDRTHAAQSLDENLRQLIKEARRVCLASIRGGFADDVYEMAGLLLKIDSDAVRLEPKS